MKAIQETLAQATQQLETICESAKKLMHKVGLYKANPSMVKDIRVDYYGVETPMKEIATISTPNTTTLQVDPWDKKLLPKIELAIVQAQNPDLRPQNTGEVIKISLPPMTGERRLQITKKIHKETENTKIKFRQERKKTNKQLDDLKNEGASEDLIKRSKEDLQKLIDKYIAKIDDIQKEVVKQINQL